MNIIVIVIIVVLLLGGIGSYPGAWSHSANWGYAPFGGIGLILIILVVLLLAGRL